MVKWFLMVSTVADGQWIPVDDAGFNAVGNPSSHWSLAVTSLETML